MERLYKIRKGLDLNLEGKAQPNLKKFKIAGEYAILPCDFQGLTPRLRVKEGEHVRVGTPLLVDKDTERVNIVAPVSGTVTKIVRGERRKLEQIVIASDEVQTSEDFGKIDSSTASAEAAIDYLLKSGLFSFLRQRPYDVIASPKLFPKSIFISAFNKMPLAADFNVVCQGREEDFKAGVQLLSRIAKVYIGIAPEQEGAAFVPTEGAEVNLFDGPNPSGNVGVQINHVCPINKGDVVWTLQPEVAIWIGHLVKTGNVDFTRRLAVAGSRIQTPQYAETPVGTSLDTLLKDELCDDGTHTRIINGNPLVGRKSGTDDFVSAFSTEICAIPEGDDVHEVLGWIAPRFKEFSTSRSYFSWLFGKKKAYDLDCRIKGGQRHMIMSAEYEKVFPMDIYPSYLVKAIITGDIDKQEELGIYEVAPEDFAVAEFIDSSKLELQRIVREGLDILRKENA